MELWGHRPMRILAFVGVVAAATLSLLPGVAAGQRTGLKDEVYVSPTWGYTVRWYANEWTVAEESTEADLDILMLQDTLGNIVSFAGMPGFAGDANACLDDMIARVLAVPSAADPITVMGQFDEPWEWRDARQSYTLMQVRLPVNGALQDHAVFLECQTLVPGEAVFQRLYAGPVEVFDRWYDDIVETLEGVFLPASAWLTPAEAGSDPPLLATGAEPLGDQLRANAQLVTDDAGDPLLLVGVADVAGDLRVMTFENVGDAPVTLDPAQLVVTVITFGETSAGPPPQPAGVTWTDGGTAAADGSRTLQPGERAEAQVTIGSLDTSAINCDDNPVISLQYRPAEGAPVSLVTQPVEGCAATGPIDDINASAAAGRPLLQLSR